MVKQLIFPDEQVNVDAIGNVVDHIAAPLARWLCRVLALPMKRRLINEIVMAPLLILGNQFLSYFFGHGLRVSPLAKISPFTNYFELIL